MLSNRKNFIIIFALILIPLISVLFIVLAKKPGGMVQLAGSTAFQPFAEKLADKYMESSAGVIVDVQGGGSALGIMASSQGIVDIGMADMVKLPVETNKLEKIIVAYDGIAVIVNPGNDISQLTTSELQKIFSGEVNDWKEAGGNLSGAIRVISREEGSGTRKSFDTLVLNGKRLSKQAMYQDSNGTIRETVKSDPNAIGYISIGFLESSVKPLILNGVEANNTNVKSGKYKIMRPVYFLLKSPVKEQTRQFVNYILSSEAQNQIEKDGLIPAK